MVYLESIVFDTSKTRNLICILNGKLKPQLCKNLSRCPFLCIMNIFVEFKTSMLCLLCCCCCTQNFSLCCMADLLSYKYSYLLRKYLLYQISLNSSLYVIFPLLQWMLYNIVVGLFCNLILYIKLSVYYIYYTL